MDLKNIGKELSKLASLEADGYIKRGKLISLAKEHFESTNSWLAWSKSHLGTSKASHYHYIKIYQKFTDGTFGKELKVVPYSVLVNLTNNSELLNKARLDMSKGIEINNIWLKEQRT
jgi:hypothetical protein